MLYQIIAVWKDDRCETIHLDGISAALLAANDYIKDRQICLLRIYDKLKHIDVFTWSR